MTVPSPRRTHWRALLASVLSCGLVFTLVACTPKPARAEDTAQEFLEKLSEQDFEGAAALTDDPQSALAALEDSWKGLGAEGLETSLEDASDNGSVGTVKYTMDWKLKKDRNYSYPNSMSLSEVDGQWQVRWKEAVIQPDLGAEQHLEILGITAPTAMVVGADGAPLLEPGTMYRIAVDTTKVRNLPAAMRRIANELDAEHKKNPDVPVVDPAAKTKEAQKTDGRFSVAMVPPEAGEAIAGRLSDVAGIDVGDEETLVRPDPSFAPDILSRVSTIVESDLQGENGWKIVSATADGAEVAVLEEQDPIAADTVRVSLDKKIQEAAQGAVNTRASSKAMMVVMRVSTGELLAVAQTPEADKDGDVALSGQYPPGSVFKIITAAAGIDHEGLNTGSTVGCPGTQEIGERIVTNYSGFSLGSVSLNSAFANSCNTSFADISSKLKPGELKDQALQFGLGQNFDIPGLTTITGEVPEGTELVDRVEAGFGQGKDLASPFGMAIVSASAAAGHSVVPQLIMSEKHHTKVTKEPATPLNPETAEQVRSMMRSVVTSGTATPIASAGEVYGKTGEAEIAGGSHAWFTGFRGDYAFATLIVLGGGSEASVDMTRTFFSNLDS